MAKISSLPTLTTITDATILPAVDSGVTQKLTGALLKSYISVGFTGSTGTQGITGFTGSTGTRGITGFTGSTGTQGITGFTGSKGDKGDPGTGGGEGITSPFASIFTITNTTVSTSTTTGALQIAGGVGIGGDVFVSESLTQDRTFTNPTEYSSANNLIFTVLVFNPIPELQLAFSRLVPGDVVVINGSYPRTVTSINKTGNIINVDSGSYASLPSVTSITVPVTTYVGSSTFNGTITVGNDVLVGNSISSRKLEVATTSGSTEYVATIGTMALADPGNGGNLNNLGGLKLYPGKNGDTLNAQGGPVSVDLSEFVSPGGTWSRPAYMAFGNMNTGGLGIGFVQNGTRSGESFSGVYIDSSNGFYSGTPYPISFSSNGTETLRISTSTIIIPNTSASTSTSSGALVVNGGVGIGGDLNAGGALYVNALYNAINLTNDTNDTYIDFAHSGSGSGQIGLSQTGGMFIASPASLPVDIVAGGDTRIRVTAADTTISNKVSITSTVASTSTSSGALVVNGGAGIGGNLNVNGLSMFSGISAFGSELTQANLDLGNTSRVNIRGNLGLTEGAISFYKPSGSMEPVPFGTILWTIGKTNFNDDFSVTNQQGNNEAFRISSQTNEIAFYSTSTFSAPVTISGLTTLAETTEILNVKTSATSIVDHDFSTGSIWYHTNIQGNFTPNFINLPTEDNRITKCTLILVQGPTPYFPSNVGVEGMFGSVSWKDPGGTPMWSPTGTAGRIEVVTYTFVRTNGAVQYVLGSLSSHG